MFWYLIYKMQRISSNEYHLTSISLRPRAKRRLMAARKVLCRNGVEWSESELLKELAKVFLRHWRGEKLKSAAARRYNHSVGVPYVRMAWYVNKVLYSVLWQRAIHSGESISRMLDFAIRTYMPRLLEEVLRSPMPGCRRAQGNYGYWQARYSRRHSPRLEVFVTYQCRTDTSFSGGLKYEQEFRILSKKQLFDEQVPLPPMIRRS